MAIEKYRVHEVAKDFGLPTKTIVEILTKYASAPKNHMQVLTDHELSVIFDYLTQHNQVKYDGMVQNFLPQSCRSDCLFHKS